MAKARTMEAASIPSQHLVTASTSLFSTNFLLYELRPGILYLTPSSDIRLIPFICLQESKKRLLKPPARLQMRCQRLIQGTLVNSACGAERTAIIKDLLKLHEIDFVIILYLSVVTKPNIQSIQTQIATTD